MKPIPEILLVTAPQTDEARDAISFRWAGDRVGKRHKLGGHPDWLQGEATPSCECGQKMVFYGQLDSVGDQIALADCGIIYVFVCFECFTTRSVLQSG